MRAVRLTLFAVAAIAALVTSWASDEGPAGHPSVRAVHSTTDVDDAAGAAATNHEATRHISGVRSVTVLDRVPIAVLAVPSAMAAAMAALGLAVVVALGAPLRSIHRRAPASRRGPPFCPVVDALR